MWLLNVVGLELKEFIGVIPRYAILSHTWNQEEVSFKEIRKSRPDTHEKPGHIKLELCCLQARKDGLEWAWIDSCCIDRRSSAELSEAINSMFKWYERADICYAYLDDIPPQNEAVHQATLARSRWFTRGWTLQELLAPSKIRFYAKDWSFLGMKSSEDINLSYKISSITGISVQILLDKSALRHASVAMRMSWAANRETTREEDRAYSLMGIFDVKMPIIYGEGLQSAFERLQGEIIKKTSDQSIFAWKSNKELSFHPLQGHGLLAPSPSYFENCAFTVNGLNPRLRPFAITNIGVQITLRLTPYHHNIPGTNDKRGDIWVATLRCWSLPNEIGIKRRLQLFLRERRIITGSGFRVFQRILPHLLQPESSDPTNFSKLVEVSVPSPDQIGHLEIIGTVYTEERALEPFVGGYRVLVQDTSNDEIQVYI